MRFMLTSSDVDVEGGVVSSVSADADALFDRTGLQENQSALPADLHHVHSLDRSVFVYRILDDDRYRSVIMFFLMVSFLNWKTSRMVERLA